MRTFARFLGTLVLTAALLALGLVALSRPARSVLTSGRTTIAEQPLELTALSERSLVYDRTGAVLAKLHVEENRSPVALEQVPEHVVHAVLDVEDDAFWEHEGVNVRAILRAALTNVQSGDTLQGGSTITQQLVKNTLLTPERTLDRKVKEAVLAVRLEDQLSKRQILEHYLNTVYFGNGAYGVQAAAETYFGIEASDLTVAQGAFLAGVIRNPVGYDPFRNPQDSRTRRNFALDRMVVLGHLGADEADRLKDEPIPAERNNPLPTRDEYFLEEVKQYLLDHPALGETAQERYNAVFRGGLRIETTFDPRLQLLAQAAMNDQLPDTQGRFTGALVSLEPGTGAVRAMVAGEGFEQAKYNLATGRGGSGRQPGSSFKPFVLLSAFENGLGPNHIINGSTPCRFPKELTGSTKDYSPENYEGSRGGVMSLAAATAKSLNCAFVRLGLALDDDPHASLRKVADTAHRLGIRKYGVDPVLAMSLGSEETTPLEMASAYGVFATDGMRFEPYFVERVLDRNGKVLLKGRGKGERITSAQNARMVTSVLTKVVSGGTGTRARLPGRDVAGKTGTSQEWRDAWFVGYTPQLATAVWMGSPVGQVSMRNVGGVRVTGGSYPARIWRAFMEPALEGEPVLRFTAPNPKEIPKGATIRESYSSKRRSTATRRSSGVRRSPATTAQSAPTPTTAGTDDSTDSTAPPATSAPSTTAKPPPTTAKPPPTTSKPPDTTAPPPDDGGGGSGGTSGASAGGPSAGGG